MDVISTIQKSYKKLSPSHKSIAEFAIDNTLEFATSTIANISQKTNVSETTVMRFAYALKYESFSKMQKEIREKQFFNKNNFITEEKEENITEKNPYANSLQRDIELLKKIEKTLDFEKANQISKDIIEAENIKIVGYRASFSVAHWLYIKLNMLRDNVSLIRSLGTDSLPNEITNLIDENTVFIIFSFPSYFKETLKIAKIAKQQKAKLIVISDRPLSSVAQLSDICLKVEINAGSENLISVASVLSVMNFITENVENSNKEKYNKRFREINSFMSSNGFYLE